LPKIRSTQRTVQVNTPKLTPPSTAGFGASGRATQQLGNEISKFAGVFDAFAQAEEKNQAANLQSDFYQLQIDSDKQLADFGTEHKGDGNSYFQGAGSIFDNNGQKFVSKYAGNDKLAQRAQTMVQGAKVQYQRKAIAKGQQIQHDRAIIKSTEISASIRGGMLTPENLKEGGLGIVQESTDKYFKIVDGLPMSEKAKTVVKQKFVKDAAKQVEDQADPSALLKWRSEIGKKLEKEGKPNAKPAKWSGKDMKGGIVEAANALGINPLDLATVISYETAGTFNPAKRGPRTQWGRHRGLIQFGEPQARRYGVDWKNPLRSQLGANGAVVKYLKAHGVKPGMSRLQVYAAINAGDVNKIHASDANNGGAPGTVLDKVTKQMAGHEKKARSLLGGDVAGFKQQETPSLDMQIAGAINWKNVEKRHEAEQEQAFMSSVISGETRVSTHDSGFMKEYNKMWGNILKPETNLLKDEQARSNVISLANVKAPLPKQVFEKLRGHIESPDAGERAKGFELLNTLENKNPAAFKKGANAEDLTKQLGIYRLMSNFKGPDGAVADIMQAEERLSKLTKDQLKTEKGAFLKTLNDVDFADELEGIHGGLFSDPDISFSDMERVKMEAEFKALAIAEFEKYGNGDFAKASAMAMLKKRYGETNITGTRTVMKYPPEAFIDEEDREYVAEHFQSVAKDIIEIERPALEAQGIKVIGSPVLISDDETEKTASASFRGAKEAQQVVVMDGLSVEKMHDASPKWRIGFVIEQNGEQVVYPSQYYYSMDGLAQRNHDRLADKFLTKQAIDELEDTKDGLPSAFGGNRGYSPNAPHNFVRKLFGYEPAEVVKKKKEIQDRENLE